MIYGSWIRIPGDGIRLFPSVHQRLIQGTILIQFGETNKCSLKQYEKQENYSKLKTKKNLKTIIFYNLLSRRRQALCRVGSKIYLFGGTSPYNGPPLFFTPEQLSMLPQQVGKFTYFFNIQGVPHHIRSSIGLNYDFWD